MEEEDLMLLTEEERALRVRADAAWRLLRDDPSVDPYEVLASVVAPRRDLEEASLTAAAA